MINGSGVFTQRLTLPCTAIAVLVPVTTRESVVRHARLIDLRMAPRFADGAKRSQRWGRVLLGWRFRNVRVH